MSRSLDSTGKLTCTLPSPGMHVGRQHDAPVAHFLMGKVHGGDNFGEAARQFGEFLFELFDDRQAAQCFFVGCRQRVSGGCIKLQRNA